MHYVRKSQQYHFIYSHPVCFISLELNNNTSIFHFLNCISIELDRSETTSRYSTARDRWKKTFLREIKHVETCFFVVLSFAVRLLPLAIESVVFYHLDLEHYAFWYLVSELNEEDYIFQRKPIAPALYTGLYKNIKYRT